jgi:hypothetical protein
VEKKVYALAYFSRSKSYIRIGARCKNRAVGWSFALRACPLFRRDFLLAKKQEMQKNKKIIFNLVAGAVLLFGIAWLSGSFSSRENGAASPGAGTGGVLSAEERSHDFGAISMAAGKVMYEFVIENNSADSIEISKIYTSCMCTEASLKIGDVVRGPFGMPGHGVIPRIRELLGAGESVALAVTFDPAAHGPAGVGRIERVVFLENSGATLEFNISATVTP